MNKITFLAIAAAMMVMTSLADGAALRSKSILQKRDGVTSLLDSPDSPTEGGDNESGDDESGDNESGDVMPIPESIPEGDDKGMSGDVKPVDKGDGTPISEGDGKSISKREGDTGKGEEEAEDGNGGGKIKGTIGDTPINEGDGVPAVNEDDTPAVNEDDTPDVNAEDKTK